jgi:hypothetical protein
MAHVDNDAADTVGVPVDRCGTPWANPYSRPDDHSEVVPPRGDGPSNPSRVYLSPEDYIRLDELRSDADSLRAEILVGRREQYALMVSQLNLRREARLEMFC